MGSTAAERQRRSRLHRKGDHSLCDPSRCDGTTPVTDVTSPGTRPPALGARGRRLWDDLSDGGKLPPARRVLLEEICRTADRLDQLDRILRGDEGAWMSFRSLNEDGSAVQVILNNALAEARQQQAVFKQMLGELRQSGAGATAPQSGPQTGGSFRDDLRARREARLADAAGR